MAARASRRRRAARPGTPARPRKLQRFMEERWGWVLAGVFVLALVWRLAYLWRLGGTPLADSLQSDARIYWDWATQLMSSGFQGSNAFFMGPLYPYVLALLRSVLGSEVSVVLIAQAAWGAGAVVLLTDAARNFVRRPIAVAIGVFAALYEMAVFFDGLVLMESLLFFLEALLLWLWCRGVFRGAKLSTFVLIGIVTGAIALGRGVGALLLLPAVWIALRAQGAPIMRTAVLVVAFLLTIAPASVHNFKASGEFIPLTYNFGYNLYVGNHANATGSSVWVGGARRVGGSPGGASGGAELDGREYLRVEKGVDLTPAASSRYWTHEAGEWIHEYFTRALTLAGRKVLLLWNHREVTQIESADLYRTRAGPLGLPWVGTFAVLAVFAVLGLVNASRAALMGTALRLWVLLMTVGIAPFFVTDRYRLHLVPALLLLAAIGIEAFLSRPRGRQSGLIPRFAIPLIGAIALVSLPLLGLDTSADNWARARGVGTRWLEKGRADLAAVEFERALALEPELEARGRLPIAASRAQLYFNMGVAQRSLGNQEDALRWMRDAAEAEPNNPKFVRTLGDAYLVSGREREGDSLLRLLPDLAGGSGEAFLSQGYRKARAGRFAEAEGLFKQAVEADRRSTAAWGALIRVQVRGDRVAEARVSVEGARDARMPKPALDTYDALVTAAEGDFARASQLLDGVPRSATDGDPILSVVRSTAEGMIQRAP